MKVYHLKLTLGKETQYNKEGKLKNQVITTKLDEFELANMLTDNNWKKVGACEVECVAVIDYEPATKTTKATSTPDNKRMQEVNDQIAAGIKQATKPKTAAQQLADQSDLMAEMSKQIAELKKDKEEAREVEKQFRADLETEANELGVSFRANIGDEKLSEKIQELKSKK